MKVKEYSKKIGKWICFIVLIYVALLLMQVGAYGLVVNNFFLAVVCFFGSILIATISTELI